MAGFGVPVIQLYTSDPSITGANPTGYILTDHNRSPLQISYETIEEAARMADGTMRKFVTANKKNISLGWEQLPAAAGYNFTVDANLSGAWLKSFYEENVFNPIWIKLTYAEEAWQFAGNNTASTRFDSTNSSFNRSRDNIENSKTFSIAQVDFTAFADGISTVTVTTGIPHDMTLNNSPEIYVTGVDQVFNGTWIADSYASNATASYVIGDFGNASATFNINSYVCQKGVATFNIDNNDFLQVGASIVISNAKSISGNSINAIWCVTEIPTSTKISFTASASDNTIGGAGTVATGTILYTPAGFSKDLSNSLSAAVGTSVASDIIKVYMTEFTYDIVKRLTTTDLVNMTIKFTEI